MHTELYLDTARLGRMCRGARSAEQEFGWLVGQLGSSLYLERFLTHGFTSLPSGFRRRVPHLRCWPGLGGFRQSLGSFLGQPVGLPAHFFAQSSSLIRFAAECLFARSRRVLATDLAWPAYLQTLQRMAADRDCEVCVIPVRELVTTYRPSAADVVRRLSGAYRRHGCDGLFLSDISYLGVKLPVEEMLVELSGSKLRFAVVDGAQAFGQRPVDLAKIPCDLYLAGTQKWFGAYHPLRVAYAARVENLPTLEKAVSRWRNNEAHPDALFQFCCAVEHADFASFGETVNVSPLIAAAGALAEACWAARSLPDRWSVLLENASSLSSWLSGPLCRPLTMHESLRSGILLLAAAKPTPHAFVPRIRQALARSGVVASAFPDGFLRLSMPRYYLSLHQKAVVARALRRCRH